MSASMPTPVPGIYFDQFWQHVRAGKMHLQRCDACDRRIYPPAPSCPDCLSMELHWIPVSGRGKVASCARFHRSYLPEYPAPHTVLAVRLEEGPIFVTTVDTTAALGDLMGRPVTIGYRKYNGGDVLPIAVLADDGR